MNVISKNATVTEQLQQRHQFITMVAKWQNSLPVYTRHINIEWLLKDSGVRCHYTNNGALAGFKLVDEKAYTWFVLRWA